MKKLVTGVALVALGLSAGPAAANHSWSNYHWPLTTTNQNFTVRLALTAPYWRNMLNNGQQTDIIANAIGDWAGDDPDRSGFTNYLQPVIVGNAATTAKRCSPTTGEIIVCSASYGARGWLGIATIWANGDHITQATTKLNETYHNSGTYSSWSWRSAVACQEVGHDFGLGHQNENFSDDTTQSCMEYTSVPADNETPDGHDYQQLQTIYSAHFNESGGGGGGNNAARPGNAPNDPMVFREVGKAPPTSAGVQSPDWGVAVGYDAEGRPNKFEQNLGNGARKITHVTWVPGFRPTREHMHDDH